MSVWEHALTPQVHSQYRQLVNDTQTFLSLSLSPQLLLAFCLLRFFFSSQPTPSDHTRFFGALDLAVYPSHSIEEEQRVSSLAFESIDGCAWATAMHRHHIGRVRDADVSWPVQQQAELFQ